MTAKRGVAYNTGGTQVTVVVAGLPVDTAGGVFFKPGRLDPRRFSKHSLEIPYGDLPKFEIRATTTITLGEVIDRAAKHFRVRNRPRQLRARGANLYSAIFAAFPLSDEDDLSFSARWSATSIAKVLAAYIRVLIHRRGLRPESVSDRITSISFFREEDEQNEEDESDRVSSYETFRTRDEDGSPSWPVRWSEATIADVLAARRSGELKGEPLRPYLCAVVPLGFGGDIASALLALWLSWVNALDGYETVRLAATLRKRLVRGTSAAGTNKLAANRAFRRPGALVTFLDTKHRTTREASKFMGLTHADTEAILWAIGYVLGDDARWRPGDDGAAQILRDGFFEIKRTGVDPELVMCSARRVRKIVEESEAPPEDPTPP
jgi:hypothetical protein